MRVTFICNRELSTGQRLAGGEPARAESDASNRQDGGTGRSPRLQALSTWEKIYGEIEHEIVARIDFIRQEMTPEELPYLEQLGPDYGG